LVTAILGAAAGTLLWVFDDGEQQVLGSARITPLLAPGLTGVQATLAL
jgi:hypothetical protein